MKYQNKKSGKVAELVQESEKYKTVLLVYEDGTDTTISTSTLKRWWKKLPEQEVVEVAPDPVETVPEEKIENELVQMPGTDGNWGEEHWAPEEDVAGDGTPLAEVGKEIAAQAKERAKQASKDKKTKKPLVIDPQLQEHMESLKSIIFEWAADNNDEIFTSTANSSLQALKVGGHLYARFTCSNKLVTVSIPDPVVLKVGTDPSRHINHLFGNVYRFERVNPDQDSQLLKILLQEARSYRVTKNLEKTKKGE